MKKKSKIILIPTQFESDFSLYNGEEIVLKKDLHMYNSEDLTAQFLYAISNDKLNIGDWVSFPRGYGRITFFDSNGVTLGLENVNHNFEKYKGKDLAGIKDCKKIIATNNPHILNTEETESLPSLPHQLPEFEQKFINWYIQSYNEGKTTEDVFIHYFEDGQICLRDNNTVYITTYVEKIYTREDVFNILKDFNENIMEYINDGIGSIAAERILKNWFDENCPE